MIMNFNKTFLRITKKYPFLQITSKSEKFKHLSSSVKNENVFKKKPSGQICQKYNRMLLQQTPFTAFSSVANEEQIKVKNITSSITIQPLQFDDVTFDQPVSHTELCTALHICDSIEEQMITLSSTLSLTPEDIENRLYFSKVIECFLKQFFGNIKIQIFGSSLNGFGFKGCDLDMSFETFSDQNGQISYLEVPDVPLVSEVLKGKVSSSEISLLPPKEQLLFIHSVLLEFYKESESPTIFINAHVPLVRFHHDRYGLKCDLSCQNRVAFANTKLLYLLGKMDERVMPLVMTVRYWAKYVELIGKGLMFNTYTITLLIIHFLQTRRDPVLPSVKYIMSLSNSLDIQDMSDTSFLEIQRLVPPSKNNQALSELLKDFFFYYLYFDFTRVICPLVGDSIPREKFFQNCSRKFRMNTICVQDPMDVTHNVAELVDYRICKKFFTELMLACRLFQNSSYLIPTSSRWGITCLFDKPEEYHSKHYNNKQISFTVPLITKEIITNTRKKDSDYLTAETLFHLLNHVLLFECRHLNKNEVMEFLKKHDEEIDKKKKICEFKNHCTSDLMNVYEKLNKKVNFNLIDLHLFDDAYMLEDFQKFMSENELISCFECKATKNTWLGRDQISLDSLPDSILNNLIEKEHFISIEASNQNEQVSKNSQKDAVKKIDPFVFLCECYVSPNVPKSTLLLNFRPFLKTNFNPILGIFLKEYLPKLMKDINSRY